MFYYFRSSHSRCPALLVAWRNVKSSCRFRLTPAPSTKRWLFRRFNQNRRNLLEGEFSSILTSPLRFFAHLITLFARASTFGGIVSPICLAAFRLMMNSNFFGCSTGRSAGLAPFKILST